MRAHSPTSALSRRAGRLQEVVPAASANVGTPLPGNAVSPHGSHHTSSIDSSTANKSLGSTLRLISSDNARTVRLKRQQALPALFDGHTTDDQARARLAQQLQLSGSEDVQDFLASLILSECVYKKVEVEDAQGLAAKISHLLAQFPPGWVQLEALQVTLPVEVPHHYIIATGRDSMYVAFMGTKMARDVVADVNALHEPVWAEALALALSTDKQEMPSAHSGFLQRARALDVERLYALAQAKGKKLVLCGHSLGGAVAKLCTLRLLRELPEWPTPPALRCMCFATPAVGNAALARLVESAGWAQYFHTFYLPEDQLMKMLGLLQLRSGALTSNNPAGSPAVMSADSSAPTLTVKQTAQDKETTGKRSGLTQTQVPAQILGPTRAEITQQVESLHTMLDRERSASTHPEAIMQTEDQSIQLGIDNSVKRGWSSTQLQGISSWAKTSLERVCNHLYPGPQGVASMQLQQRSQSLEEANAVSDREAAALEDILSRNGSAGNADSMIKHAGEPVSIQREAAAVHWTTDTLQSLDNDVQPQLPRMPAAKSGEEGSKSVAAQQGTDGTALTSGLSSLQPANPPSTNLAMSWALMRNRAGRQLQRVLGFVPPVQTIIEFHAFGKMLYLGRDSVYAVRPISVPSQSADAIVATAELAEGTATTAAVVKDAAMAVVGDQGAAALPETVVSKTPIPLSLLQTAATKVQAALPKSPFAHHRMRAYRLRVLRLIWSAIEETQHSHHNHTPHLLQSIQNWVSHPRSLPWPSPLPSHQHTISIKTSDNTLDLASDDPEIQSLTNSTRCTTPVTLTVKEDLVPQMQVTCAAARMPVPPGLMLGAAVASKALSELVEITVLVDGIRIQHSRSVRATVLQHGSTSAKPITLNTRVMFTKTSNPFDTAGPGAGGKQPLDVQLQHMHAGNVARVRAGLLQVARSVSRLVRWPGQQADQTSQPNQHQDELCTVGISVRLPRALLQQLATSTPAARDRYLVTSPSPPPVHAHAHARRIDDSARQHQGRVDHHSVARTGAAHGSTATASSHTPDISLPIQAGPELRLTFQSDFQVLEVPVRIVPWRVGVLGITSDATATLMSELRPKLAVVAAGAAAASGNRGIFNKAKLHSWFPWVQRQAQPSTTVAHSLKDETPSISITSDNATQWSSTEVPPNEQFNVQQASQATQRMTDSGGTRQATDTKVEQGNRQLMLPTFPVPLPAAAMVAAVAAAAVAPGASGHMLQLMPSPDMQTAAAALGLTAAAVKAAGLNVLPLPKEASSNAAATSKVVDSATSLSQSEGSVKKGKDRKDDNSNADMKRKSSIRMFPVMTAPPLQATTINSNTKALDTPSKVPCNTDATPNRKPSIFASFPRKLKHGNNTQHTKSGWQQRLHAFKQHRAASDGNLVQRQGTDTSATPLHKTLSFRAGSKTGQGTSHPTLIRSLSDDTLSRSPSPAVPPAGQPDKRTFSMSAGSVVSRRLLPVANWFRYQSLPQPTHSNAGLLPPHMDKSADASHKARVVRHAMHVNSLPSTSNHWHRWVPPRIKRLSRFIPRSLHAHEGHVMQEQLVDGAILLQELPRNVPSAWRFLSASGKGVASQPSPGTGITSWFHNLTHSSQQQSHNEMVPGHMAQSLLGCAALLVVVESSERVQKLDHSSRGVLQAARAAGISIVPVILTSSPAEADAEAAWKQALAHECQVQPSDIQIALLGEEQMHEPIATRETRASVGLFRPSAVLPMNSKQKQVATETRLGNTYDTQGSLAKDGKNVSVRQVLENVLLDNLRKQAAVLGGDESGKSNQPSKADQTWLAVGSLPRSKL